MYGFHIFPFRRIERFTATARSMEVCNNVLIYARRQVSRLPCPQNAGKRTSSRCRAARPTVRSRRIADRMPAKVRRSDEPDFMDRQKTSEHRGRQFATVRKAAGRGEGHIDRSCGCVMICGRRETARAKNLRKIPRYKEGFLQLFHVKQFQDIFPNLFKASSKTSSRARIFGFFLGFSGLIRNCFT